MILTFQIFTYEYITKYSIPVMGVTLKGSHTIPDKPVGMIVFSHGSCSSRLSPWNRYLAHNIAKIETHRVHDKNKKVIVHRKGATLAFGPGSPEIPEDFKNCGQPVLIPGSMGTHSYVLAGTG